MSSDALWPRPDDVPTIRAGSGRNGAMFGVGELVADRFHIVRFIARGGMGEVYEAEDRELREHVALKTIRPEIAADEQAIERFRREIRLARQVTHPNVCRIYDVFRLEAGTASSPRKVVFVTMELLRGETLAERLRREGRMSTEAVCRWCGRWPARSRPRTTPASCIAISRAAT